MIEIIDWFRWDTGKANNGCVSGLSCQVTIGRYCGHDFCVRENVNGISSFEISSGERWGDKIGKKPRPTRQVLELLAPKELWEEIAREVTKADDLHRPVKRNERLTWKWVEKNRSL